MRRVAALAICGLVLASSAQAVPFQSWVATARIGSGNTTLTDSPDPPSPSGPDDTSGFLEANGANVFPPSPPIDAGALATYGLSTGTIATTVGFAGTSNAPGDQRNFTIFGGASAIYVDDLTVTSSTLAAGTPVQVRFAFALAWSADVMSTQSTATTAADFSSTAAGSTRLDQEENRYLLRLDDMLMIQSGIFSGANEAEYDVDTTIGATFSFAVVLDVDSFGEVTAPGGVNNTASGWSTMAVSFGAEVVGADAQISAALLGGAFPQASAVSQAAAAAAYPANPFDLPEPHAIQLFAVAWMTLGFLRRARR